MSKRQARIDNVPESPTYMHVVTVVNVPDSTPEVIMARCDSAALVANVGDLYDPGSNTYIPPEVPEENLQSGGGEAA